METFATSVEYLKDVVIGIGNSKGQDIAATRNLYMALCKVEMVARSAPQTELVATSNLVCVEEIFNSKFVTMNRSIIVLVVAIYEVMLRECPGYVVRNVMNTLVTVCNSKVSSMSTRECAVTVLGVVLEKRSADVGSMINDALNSMIRLIRGTENPVRLAAANATVSVLAGAGSRASDCHPELSKLCAKINTDRQVDLRQRAAMILGEVSGASSGFTTVAFDALLGPAVRGLEDEVGAVQESFAEAVALIYVEQIHSHAEEQEQARAGIARGGAAANDAAKSPPKTSHRGSLSKLKDITGLKDMITSGTAQKKAGEEHDWKSVLQSIFRTMTRAAPVVRAGYVSVLRHLIRLLMRTVTMDSSSLEWLVTSVVLLLRDSAISALPYEEVVNFRSRLSHLIRSGIACYLTEANQVVFAKALTTFLSTTESRTEHEVQLTLGELGHVVTALGEVAACICDEVKTVTNLQLRNSSFGARAAAAYLLASLATVLPGQAAVFLKDALTGAALQAKQLLAFDEADFSASAAASQAQAGVAGDGSGEEGPGAPGSVSPALLTSPRRNPKDMERLQRMFFFHGHSLVISIFLKNEKWLPTGLPSELIMKAFDFGLEMLTLDIQTAPQTLRHVVCSVIRAGSLIVSSCLNMGYRIAKPRIGQLLDCCNTLLRPTASPPPTENTAAAGQDLLYELMSAEAALVCISTLLWFCPDSLVYDDNCLITIVDGLESVFRAIKGKYQAKFRGHFRFRTLHVILLECFAWLPPGSFPNTCPQLFVEALRVFRDSISSGYECTCLSEFVPPDHAILHVCGVSKPPTPGYNDPPPSEDLMVLRLEQHSVALQKKESEAFLACFSKEVHLPEFRRTPLHATDWTEPTPPCAFIDSRTVDASIALIAATFGHQTNEYQEKAVQLCSQAMAQYLKTASSSAALGIFSSEDDRRKKDKKSYISIKNVTAVLSAIIRSFPFHNGMSLELDLQWVGAVADRIFEMLSFPNIEIRAASATALGVFCSKIFGAQLMDSMGMKITQAIRNSVDRKGETMADLSGHVLALSSLWLHAGSHVVQDNILTIVFDTLKRVDCSLMFRAHGVFSLSCILKHRAHSQTASDVSETNSLIEKVVQVLEVHLLCVGLANDPAAPHEYPLLLVSLQRLINTIVPTILEVDPESYHMENIVKMWNVIRRACSICAVQLECADFLLAISGYPVTALDTREAAAFVKESIQHPARTNTHHLRTAVACVRSLVLQNAAAVKETGLDMELFSLLDWCIASCVTACTSPYWGVELRSGVDTVVMGSTRVLQHEIENVIESLVAVEVPGNPDKYTTEWVLLSRVIALGLRGGVTSAAQGDKDAEHDPENDDGEAKSSGAHHDLVAEGEPQAMTSHQFSNWCRDNALARAKDVMVSRVRVKCVALRCATFALTTCRSELSPTHSDISKAKGELQQQLNNLNNPKPDDATLHNLPCYLSLFLHDLVNLGCACASFSVEDHHILELQTVALEFLDVIMHQFWNTIDPDDHSRPSCVALTNLTANVPAAQKILMQFMAQIVSAIRPSLSAKWAPNLQWISGGLVSSIILDGLLNDKVVVRRLAKMLMHGLDGERAKAFQPRAAIALEVAGEVATVEHIVCAANMARLFLLTTDYGRHVGCIDKSIQDLLESMLSPHLAVMESVWMGVAVDAARVLQSQTTWPKSLPVTDCRRGGVTYSPDVDPVKLVWHLEYALPFVTAAVALSPDLPSDRIPAMFSITVALLGHLNAHAIEAGISTAHIEGESFIRGMKGTLEPVALVALRAIAERCTTYANDCLVPLSEWSHVVGFLTNDLVLNFSDVSASGMAECSVQCDLTGQIADALLSHLLVTTESAIDADETTKEDRTHLASRLWVCAMALAKIALAGLFLREECNCPDVTSSEFIYPAIDVPKRGELSAMNKWWLSNPIGCKLATRVAKIFVQAAVITQSLDMAVFSANLLTAMIPYVAACIAEPNQKLEVLGTLTELMTMFEDIALPCEVTLDALVGLPAASGDASFFSSDADVADCARVLFSCWLRVCLERVVKDDGVTLQVPTVLTSLLIQDGPLTAVQQGILTSCLQAIKLYMVQQQPPEYGRAALCIVTSSVIPPVLHVLGNGGYSQFGSHAANTDILALNLVFLLYNILPDDHQRTAYLNITLPSLCGILQSMDHSSSPAQLCGKGITHIARSSPQIFRGEIMLLPEQSRVVLQNAMRAVLEAMNQSAAGQNAPQSAATGHTQQTTHGGIKKIDMSKYRGGS